jgi:hypothetical protein
VSTFYALRARFTVLTVLHIAAFVAMPFSVGRAEVVPLTSSGFSVVHQVTLPGTPGVIYDAFTGDVKPWWDHSWSENPKALYIEPKPGGGFYEIFDDSGNGALHATVITAWRGKLLRMDGPLGLAGEPIAMVHTLEFTAVGADSTTVKLTANGAGHVKEWVPGAVNDVWKHFLIERFKPYVESGQHLKKTKSTN